MRPLYCRATPGKDSSLEFEPLDQFHQRRKKLTEIEALGHASYPHRFEWTHTAKQVTENFGERTEAIGRRARGRVRGRTHPCFPPPRESRFRVYSRGRLAVREV